jgi:hypothetical protein
MAMQSADCWLQIEIGERGLQIGNQPPETSNPDNLRSAIRDHTL